MKKIRSIIKEESGQSIVEFALVLPVLMLIVVGIVEFGWLFNGKITLTSAAREGARVAAIVKNQETATLAVNQTANLSGLTIEEVKYVIIDGGLDDVDKVKVTVRGSMEPLISLFIDDSVEMESVAYMRVE